MPSELTLVFKWGRVEGWAYHPRVTKAAVGPMVLLQTDFLVIKKILISDKCLIGALSFIMLCYTVYSTFFLNLRNSWFSYFHLKWDHKVSWVLLKGMTEWLRYRSNNLEIRGSNLSYNNQCECRLGG